MDEKKRTEPLRLTSRRNGGNASWLYKRIAGVGQSVIIEFKIQGGEFIWTRDPSVRH